VGPVEGLDELAEFAVIPVHRPCEENGADLTCGREARALNGVVVVRVRGDCRAAQGRERRAGFGAAVVVPGGVTHMAPGHASLVAGLLPEKPCPDVPFHLHDGPFVLATHGPYGCNHMKGFQAGKLAGK